MNMRREYKIAFSFRSTFRNACIEPIIERLRNDHNFSEDEIFMDVQKNVAGFYGVQELVDIFENKSDMICVFISDDYFDSDICAKEWNSIKKVFDDNHERVIPICMGIPGNDFWSKSGVSRESVICLDSTQSTLDIISKKISERYDKLYPRVAHNHKFADIYTERLCLHKNSPYDVCLKNVYVEPMVTVGDNINMPIGRMIDNFISSKNDILLIFGDGGFGKTSTIAKLAYEYEHGQKEYNKKIIIIRLRQIAKYMGSDRDIFAAIQSFIGFKDNVPDNTIWILDGLDELCMISGTNDARTVYSGASGYIKRLCRLLKGRNSKIIITTRPGIDQAEFSIYFAQTRIRHAQCNILDFDENQTKLFISLLVKAAPYLKEQNGGIKFILSDKKNEMSSDIYRSAFILYLICSNNLTNEECENIWALFHRIFYKSLVVPEYRYDGAEGNDINEFNSTYINDIYKINCQIAFEMFKEKDNKATFTLDDVSSLLDIDDETVVKKINDSYSLCCYTARNNSVIEFAHNHIRDFFICEKILTELNAAYSKRHSPEDIVNKLCELLKYDLISYETEIFIEYAFRHNAYNVIQSQSASHVKDIFTLFLKSGGLLSYNYSEGEKNYQYYSMNTVNNASNIYTMLYHPDEKSRLIWFEKQDVYNERHSVIEYMTGNLRFSDFSGMDLSLTNLRGYGLHGCNFSGAMLFGANLRNTYMTEAILENADLSFAELQGASFAGASLHNAILFGAKFDNSLMDAVLNGIDLSGAMYDATTIFPKEFNPQEHDMKYIKD